MLALSQQDAPNFRRPLSVSSQDHRRHPPMIGTFVRSADVQVRQNVINPAGIDLGRTSRQGFRASVKAVSPGGGPDTAVWAVGRSWVVR